MQHESALTRALVEKVLHPAFAQGIDMTTIDDVKCVVTARVCDALSNQEWANVMQTIDAWRNDDIPVLDAQVSVNTQRKFPNVETVRKLTNDTIAASYAACLEEIETNETLYNMVHDNIVNTGWSRKNIESAINYLTALANKRPLQTNVSRKRVRQSADPYVKELQIWFPITREKDKWLTDPRTVQFGEKMWQLTTQVSDIMRKKRTLLQFIPRRKFSVSAMTDAEANMERMHQYIQNTCEKK